MQKLIDSLEVFLFLSVPETFVVLWMSFLICGIRTTRQFVRLPSAALLISFLQVLMFLSLPTYTYVFYSTAAFFAVVAFVYRELRLRTRILISALSFIVGVILELAILITLSPSVDQELIRTGPVVYKIIYAWPVFGVCVLICVLMQRYRRYPAIRIARYISAVKDASILSYIALLTLQFIVLMVYVVVTFLDQNKAAESVFFIMGVLSVIVVSLSALHIITRAKNDAVSATRAAYLGDLLSLLESIRRQRHDFINHVQVMYAMLGMKRTDQLADYMKQLVQDIDQIGGFADRIPLDALASLIDAKASMAADCGISFTAGTPERMEDLDPIYITDLVRVVGSLTDQSFERAMELPPGGRIVHLEIDEQEGAYAIHVTVPGGVVPAELPGRETPLSIVRDRVKKYRGRFEIRKGETVVYSVLLPKQTDVYTGSARTEKPPS